MLLWEVFAPPFGGKPYSRSVPCVSPWNRQTCIAAIVPKADSWMMMDLIMYLSVPQCGIKEIFYGRYTPSQDSCRQSCVGDGR